jgi:hypothetical protein
MKKRLGICRKALVFLPILLCSIHISAAPPTVHRSVVWVEIITDETTFLFRKGSGGFLRVGKNASLPAAPIDSKLIKALVIAISRPALIAPDPANLGITQDVLKSHADDWAEHSGYVGETSDAHQKEFLIASFSDLSLVRKVLPGVLNARWTDDGAWVKFSVRFSDGSNVIGSSDQLPPFMLPWKMDINGHKVSNFNAEISRAIAAVLPADAQNQERLKGTGFDQHLQRAMMTAVRSRWKEIGADDLAGDALAQIRKTYVVKRSEVSPFRSLAFYSSFDKEQPIKNNLHVDARRTNFPENLVDAAVFPMANDSPVGVNLFLSHAAKYEAMVLGNEWIMRSLHTHPDMGAWLYFIEDSSCSEKALKVFTADMHLLGKDELAHEVAEHREDVALLNYYGNQILLFPDHHAILWRWETRPYREPFTWPAASVKTEYCSDYNTSTEGCVGRVLDPNGNLVP